MVDSVADPVCLSRITDPTFFHPGSEFFPSRIHIKEFKYFNPKLFFKLSEIWSGLFIADLDPPDFLPIPDPGSRGQKAPDPGSGCATLVRIQGYGFVSNVLDTEDCSRVYSLRPTTKESCATSPLWLALLFLLSYCLCHTTCGSEWKWPSWSSIC